jgi:O-antigen ligase
MNVAGPIRHRLVPAGPGRTGPAAPVLAAVPMVGPPRLRKVTNLAYLSAVLAINFTLTRPSPVDIMFVTALVLSLVSRQMITRNIFIFVTLILTWLGSLYVSSIALISNPEVTYYMVKISFAVSIGLCSSLVAAHWNELDLDRFLKTYIASNCIAAMLGVTGFLLGIEELMWDGRAKGFLDDPNMYGAFLLPGILASMYYLAAGGRRLLYGAALALLSLGLLMSFSRAAIVAALLWGGAYYLFLNRRNLPRAAGYAALGILALALLVAASTILIDGMADKLADRSTVAKPYDLGHDGRYGRYALSIGYILENPFGLGLLTWDMSYDEPIHNILLSSFMNYGWVAGLAFVLLLVFTVAISLSNYRATQNPAGLVVSVAWLAIVSCAFLHEAERWRHLWLFTGLVWGLNARHLVATQRPATKRRVGRRGEPQSAAIPQRRAAA